MAKKDNHEIEPVAFHARTSGLLPRDKIENVAVGSGVDAQILRAVYGATNQEFFQNLVKEDRDLQHKFPDRFIIKAATFGRKGRKTR